MFNFAVVDVFILLFFLKKKQTFAHKFQKGQAASFQKH